MNTNFSSSHRLTTIPAAASNASSASSPFDMSKSPSYYVFLNNAFRTADTILLDTSSLVKTAFDGFVHDAVPLLKKNGKSLTVLQGVVGELRYLASSGSSADVMQKATRALQTVSALTADGTVVYKGNPNTNDSGCAAIIKYAAEHVWDSHLFVLTQDAQLARDLRLFSEIKSSTVNPVVIKRLAELNGRLDDFKLAESGSEAGTTPAPARASSAENSNTAAILRQRFGL